MVFAHGLTVELRFDYREEEVVLPASFLSTATEIQSGANQVLAFIPEPSARFK